MNPYLEILGLTKQESISSGVITTGTVTSVSPLKIKIGELEYESHELKFLSHVVKPNQPEDIGTVVLVATLNEYQSFYVIGRV